MITVEEYARAERLRVRFLVVGFGILSGFGLIGVLRFAEFLGWELGPTDNRFVMSLALTVIIPMVQEILKRLAALTTQKAKTLWLFWGIGLAVVALWPLVQ